MADWQPREGATLLMPSGTHGHHLFVVLNDPRPLPGYGNNPHVVLVNLSTVREGVMHDATCVLPKGCHAFVKQESFVYYRGARIESVDHVQRLVRQGVFKPHDPIPAEIVAEIKAGLKRSPFAKREFKGLRI